MGFELKAWKIIWRIRAIKPEVHRDRALALAERVSGLPVLRVYEGLWSACDREGRFPWDIDELQRGILPWDADRWSIEKILAVLVEGGWIVQYETRGLPWGWVPRFLVHQRPNLREAASCRPAPPPAAVDAWVARWQPTLTPEAPEDANQAQDEPGATGAPTEPQAAVDGCSPDSPEETDGLHVHARACTCTHVNPTCMHVPPTCSAPLGTRNLEQEGGTQGCQPTAAQPAAAPVPPHDACGEGGEACHGPARKRPRPPAEPPGPLDVPATAAQLETLAAMAAERGTTLAREAAAAGVPAPIRKRDVTGLRHRLEALPRLKPDQAAGGRAVLWSDVRQLLDANAPAMAAELLAELPEGGARGELWRKVEQRCRDLLPRDVDPQAVLDAAGVESVRQDLPRVWAVIQAIRAGDRSMLPAEFPDTPEGEQARLLAPKIAWHIENHGNGNRAELAERLGNLGRIGDHLGVLAMARELGLQLEGVASR